MSKVVGIVDYGVGNLRCVAKAVARAEASSLVSSDPGELATADVLILPGVGAFGFAMDKLQDTGLGDWVVGHVRSSGTPIIGICLGMQLLATESEESLGVPGLGLIDAIVKRLDPGKGKDQFGRPYHMPHMGWNSILKRTDSALFSDMADGSDFYFANSYHVVCRNESDIAAETEYGQRFVSALERDNVLGVQFHPEKSQSAGLGVLKNFIGIRIDENGSC